jgi:hypothetical protein
MNYQKQGLHDTGAPRPVNEKTPGCACLQGRSKVWKAVPPPSHAGGIKSRRRIAIRRYTCAP